MMKKPLELFCTTGREVGWVLLHYRKSDLLETFWKPSRTNETNRVCPGLTTWENLLCIELAVTVFGMMYSLEEP